MLNLPHPYTKAQESLYKAQKPKQMARIFNKLAKSVHDASWSHIRADQDSWLPFVTQSIAKQKAYAEAQPEHSRKKQAQMICMASEMNKMFQASVIRGQNLPAETMAGYFDNIADHMMQSYLFNDLDHPVDLAAFCLTIMTQQKHRSAGEKFPEIPALDRMVEKAFNNMQLYMFDPGFQFESTKYQQFESDFCAVIHLYQAANIYETPMGKDNIQKTSHFLERMREQAPAEFNASLMRLSRELTEVKLRQDQIHSDAHEERLLKKQIVRKLKR